jgi:hypothetical protein
MENKNSRDSPEMVESELDDEEIKFLEENFRSIEIDGVTYYLVTM